MLAAPYLNEMPYCETVSKPLFHTSVTSQALVADSRHERKAETELPPTIHDFFVSFAILARRVCDSIVMARNAVPCAVFFETSLKSGYCRHGTSEIGDVSY